MACKKAILHKGQNNQIEFDVTDNHATLDAFLSKQYPSYFSNKLQSINENIDISHNLVLDYDDVLESNGRQTELSKEIAGKIKSGELSADKVFVATARTDNEKGTQQKDIADSLGIPVENVKLNVYGQAKADFVKGLEGDSTFIDNDKTNTDAVAKVGGRTILLPTESKRTAEAIQKDIDGLNSIIAKSKGKSKAALQEELDVLHKELEGVAKTEPTKSEVKKQEPYITKETANLKRQRTKKLKEVQAKIDTIKKELEGISNTKRNAKKIAGLNDQITTLERERVSIIEEYDNKIKALTESKIEEAPNIVGGIPVEDITKTNTNEKEEVQKTQEVKVDEPVEKKTGSTSISQKVRNKIKTYFDKLVGEDTNLITVSTAKLEEIAKSKGFDSFKAMALSDVADYDTSSIRLLSTPSGKIYGLFIEADTDGKPHIYLSDDFTTGALLEEMKHFQYFVMKIAAENGDAEASRIIKEANKILAPIVNKVIAAQGKTEPTEKSITIGGIRTDVRVVDSDVVNGFYSPLERIIANTKADKLPVKQWVEKFGKGEEAKWTGLSDWLNNQTGSISKQGILNYLENNRVEIVEVVKQDNTSRKFYASSIKTVEKENGEYKVYFNNGFKITIEDYFGLTEDRAIQLALDEINRIYNYNTHVSYDKFQLEGQKEDYKEILVTLPKAHRFKSSHFDEPNILVHLRINTRIDSEGKKVLFLEEIQSDWGQKGKKEGFVTTNAEKRKKELLAKDELTKGELNELDSLNKELGFDAKIPTAPFVTDTNAWVKLGLKVALKEAVAQGVAKIAWTTGEQQNDRYDLSKQVDYIDYWRNENGTYGFSLPVEFTKPSELTASELENYLGKEVAKKIIDNSEPKIITEETLLTKSVAEGYIEQGKDVYYEIDGVKKGKINSLEQINDLKFEYRGRVEFIGEVKTKEYPKESKPNRLQGQDLKVGGKGMIGFYGSPTEGSLGIVGNVAKGLFKQEPKTVKINTSIPMSKEANKVFDDDGWTTGVNELALQTQHSIDITPELKKEVSGGIPLFSAEDPTNRNEVLQEIKREYGIDLMSEVYKQQKNETDEAYQDRIFDEVWAKITVAEGEKDIKANYTFWNKVKELLGKIQEWFVNSLGLKDQDLSNLSPYELGKQSFNSLMKGEFITSKPIVIEAEKNPVGGYKPAKNVQEIFDRLPEDVKEYFRTAEGWDEKTGVKNIPQRLLKILDDDKVATSTKLAMLGKATSLFKKPWNLDMKKEVVEAFLSNTTTLDEFLEAADEILNSDNYKDLSNISLNERTYRSDMIVLEQLYKYFRENVTKESEDILTKVSLIYAKVASLSGTILNMTSPSMSMEDLVGSFTILSHAALTKLFNTSVDGKTLQSEIDKLQERLKLKSDYIETLVTKIKELTINSKKTHKVEVIASGFVGGNKAVEKAKKNLINIVSGLKGSTQVPRASASLRFSAEPINDVEVALANLLLTNYINKKGDLLQAKLALQAQLEALKNVDGKNVYEMMVAKLPAGYAILEKLDTGETKSDLIKSSVFKEMRAKANREAALNTFTNRLVGTDKIKNIAQRVKNLDFVDSFIKHLAARVLKKAAINITDAVMGIDTTILKNPAVGNEGADYKIIRKYYKQVEDIKNNLDNSLIDNIEAEKQLKEINKKMKQDLSKFSSFKDTYPSFEFNYQDTPVAGSVLMDDKKTYMYDSKEGVWRDQKDMRPVSDITNDRLTKSYSSKLFTENYLKSTAKALGNYLTDNTNVAAIMKDAYNSFKEGKHDIKTIRKIEDMIYAAYNVDVTGYVALRHMIEDDSVLRDKTLTELLQNVYSKQATADLATELTDRLGIEEYDSMKAADAIKNFISDEISPKLEEELKDFLNNDTKLIREAMRLAIDGKISAMDLLPVVAKKFNLRGWDEGSVHEFETLVEAVKNKNASPLERKKALLELRQFFIDHKNEPLIKYIADGLVSMTYNDLFSIRTFFTAMGSMANTVWSTFRFMVEEFGDVVYTNIFTPNDSNKITFREYGVLVSEVTAGAFTEMMRKGFTESIRALVTGKGSDIFMAEDARLRSNTWYNKAFTDKFNKLTTSTYNSIKSKLIGKYKELNPIITTKNGKLVFTEFHPLFNFKELLGAAIRDGVKNPFIAVAESLEAKIFDYENIGRELYLKERDKYNEAKRAAAWLRANQDSFISGTLPSTYDVTKSAGKDIANIGAWIMGSTVALGYRSMVLPVIGDALVSTPATYANVAINTYLEMKGKDRVSGDMAKTLRTALGFSEKTEEDLKAAFGKPPSLLKMATMMLTHPVDTQTNYIEKKVEIIESNRNQDVWDEARRPVAEATAVAAPRGVAGVIANSISHWFHGIIINQALAVTPDSNKFARVAKPIGATLAMLIERAIFPFVFKVGTNAFNINVRQLPGGYYIMKGITKGFAHFTKDNINNEDWHKGRDGNYHNGKWSIVPSDGLYKLYENKKTKYAESQEQVGDAMTLDEAKAKAFNSNTMVSRGFVDLINPDKNFVGKYTRKGLQIEEMYDLNEVEKTTLASSSLLSLSMLAYALFSMYDWDEDEDGRWKLIRDPEATIVINGHMTNSYYKDKSSANGIAPMSLQWKDNNGKYHTILSLENIMIRGLFYAIIGIDDYVRNDEMRVGDKYTAINVGESKLEVAWEVAKAMVTGSIKLATNEVLSRNFGESAGWLVDGIRYKSFKSQKDLQDQEKGYYNMIRPFKQMGLGMLGANANRKYISAMSSVGVEDRYKATDRTFQPIADIMYSDYNLPSWGLRKLGVISKEASEQLLANLMFSDYGRYIGEPIFGIKGSFEDNFTKVYHSPRGTRLSQEFIPTGAFRVKNYEATIGDKSDFDKWGEANGIGASYKFMEPNTFVTNITTPEQNIKLQKEVENSAPIIAEQLFKNNIGEFNKMINKVEDKVKTIDGIYMGDNTYEKYKLKQKFNETILNKSYEIAVVLGVRKMIKDNPKNISLIEFNNNSNKTLKDAKQREGINFYKDGTFTLDIVSSTSDPKFTSEEFKIIPSVESPNYTYNLEMNMDFTINPNKLGELDRNQMQGLLEEKPRVYNVTIEKLGELLTAKTIYKVNDRKYNIGVVLNSNNELIPVTDIYKELVEKAESKQYKR